MEQNDSFDVLNIWNFLKSDNQKLGEDTLREYLSEFSCPLNPDVERFLKEQAVDFAKKHQAVTYLLVSNKDNALLGKNFSEDVVGRITGRRLLDAAVEQLQIIQRLAGGMVSFVETENRGKLLAFYENYGYKRFSKRVTSTGDSHELVQLLKLI